MTWVGTRNFSFCSPSRGETSTILTDDMVRKRKTGGNGNGNREDRKRKSEESVEEEEREEEALKPFARVNEMREGMIFKFVLLI